MADNISVTPGTGKTIAADDVGGVLYQRVKIAHGADGSATDVAVTSPLPVASAAYTPSLTVTRPNNTTPYSAGDVVTSLLTFMNFGPESGGEVAVVGTRFQINVTSVPSGMTNFFLYLYTTQPTTSYSDNDAWDLPVEDRAAFMGRIDLGTPVDLGSTLYVQQNNYLGQFTVPAGGSIYAYLVTNGAFTPTAEAVKKLTIKTVNA